MEAIFTFAATRGAIGGEKALEDGGLAVKVMALPSSLGAGCGLCLRVEAAEAEKARGLLAAAGLVPEGVYLKDGSSSYRPLPL